MGQDHPSRISVLPGFEAIRRRPLLYVPNLSSQGLHWLAAELAHAAIEPSHHNHCSHLRLVISPDGALTQIDDGPGLPLNPRSAADPRSVLDIALTCLFAGQGPPASFYAQYGFLAGLGPILNSLSESLSVTTHRDRRTYRTSYARGYLTEPLAEVESSGVSGSVIRIRPDRAVWNEPHFSRDALQDVMWQLAANYPTVTMTIYDERLDTEIRLP